MTHSIRTGRRVPPVHLPLHVLPLLAILLLGPGCTAVGYNLGQSVDEASRTEMAPSSLTDADLGRPVDLVTTDDRRVTGRLRALIPGELGSDPEIRLLVERKGQESIFRDVAASSDTIAASSIETLRLGGKPGNGASIGVMCGLVADVLVLWSVTEAIQAAFAGWD